MAVGNLGDLPWTEPYFLLARVVNGLVFFYSNGTTQQSDVRVTKGIYWRAETYLGPVLHSFCWSSKNRCWFLTAIFSPYSHYYRAGRAGSLFSLESSRRATEGRKHWMCSHSCPLRCDYRRLWLPYLVAAVLCPLTCPLWCDYRNPCYLQFPVPISCGVITVVYYNRTPSSP